ncbi:MULTISPECIES: hypothetical protein [unclassified Paenibacillus]|uniref:hypothetical protein n=1 Tax=unclassified Paenibacillus TaxID=185978 RepID=UPI00020D7408|nr:MULTISPECIES: hypothetical protein [unclassified Paenibacillus]EGL17538.1 hypothetical protein HMPREF9413_5410 [Paenibacillus sp. HGF7]EPD81260.1 hypothetical protein HMPREF1207_05017 [Paenibacillus sp. HGH0039]
MNFKALTIGALVGISLVFGSVGAFASPVNANASTVSPHADQTLILRIGEVYNTNGYVTILNNPQNAVVVEFQSYVKGLQPGQALISVNKNGQITTYDVFVKAF